jgi:hypothetical protein
MCLPPFNFWSNWQIFNEIWYESYASVVHLSLTFFNFLQLVLTAWWLYEIVRYKQHEHHLMLGPKIMYINRNYEN